MRFNGAATLASIKANVWCAVDGVGERVPVRLLDGGSKDPSHSVTLACNRRLTPDSTLQIVVGRVWQRPAVS